MRLFGTERRACAFIAAVALLALLLAACTGHGSGTETDGPDGTEREPEDVITASELAGYKFIRAEDCGSELGKAFVALHESFNKIAGVATEKSDDFYREGVPELEMKECEILIGGTNRPESKKFLSGLRSDDYGYALIGKKLVIAGRTEANTVKAIEAFEENVLSRFEKNGAAGTFMSSGDNYTFGAEYSVDSVDLCGTDIGKWTVVYPKKDTMGEAVAAERTRDIIASHCGFTVDVIRDDMAPADLENVISVGITAFTSDALADGLKKAGSGATSSAFIGYDGKTVLVGGKDSASLLAAVDSLGKELSDAAARDGRSVTLTLDAEKTYDVADTMLTAMSFNNLVSSKSAERTERVTEMVLKYMPDTIGFQETSSDWMNSLIAKLKGVYRETAEIYTSAQDEYGHSIQGDFEAQADAAANLIKQAGYVDSTPAAALQEAEDALATWNDTDDSPAVQYAANRRLYNAVDTLYASLNNKVDDSTQRALDDQYNAFVSAQATIERAANVYNLWVEDYEKTVSQFPANLISGLWGAQAPERFATK